MNKKMESKVSDYIIGFSIILILAIVVFGIVSMANNLEKIEEVQAPDTQEDTKKVEEPGKTIYYNLNTQENIIAAIKVEVTKE